MALPTLRQQTLTLTSPLNDNHRNNDSASVKVRKAISSNLTVASWRLNSA
jgi:hypothetical protein